MSDLKPLDAEQLYNDYVSTQTTTKPPWRLLNKIQRAAWMHVAVQARLRVRLTLDGVI